MDAPAQLQQLIGGNTELPSLPEVYLKASALLEDEDSSIRDIGDVVELDPAIAARVLKVVNSAYFGLPNQVSSVHQAISLLGRVQLKQIILGAVLVNVMSFDSVGSFTSHSFWEHSVKGAVLSRLLAREAGETDAESLFTAGLLRDMGKPLLYSKVPEVMQGFEPLRERIDIERYECDKLGFSHSEVTEFLLLNWKVPPMISTCVRHHHNSGYQGEYTREVQLVYLANQLSYQAPAMDEDECLEQLDQVPNWDLPGLAVEQIMQVTQIADDMVFTVMDSLGMIAMEIDV